MKGKKKAIGKLFFSWQRYSDVTRDVGDT